MLQTLVQEHPSFMENVGPACSKGKCDQGKRVVAFLLTNRITVFFDKDEYPHDKLIFGMR